MRESSSVSSRYSSRNATYRKLPLPHAGSCTRNANRSRRPRLRGSASMRAHRLRVTLAAAAGFAKLGDHDIVELVARLGEDPLESSGGIGWTKAQLLGM